MNRVKFCEVLELNVQPDHVHLVVMAQSKISISILIGRGKVVVQSGSILLLF
ncbi:TPA: transposase [Escherichia coli]|uniref:transposase n=1 Tax=Escherichia coli TaxID=562 RepID=UPI00388FE036|nr:transposase [Escherichia coli]HCB2839943.1 transposase [Escherichia coli]